MQVLQGVEGAEHILHIGQSFGALAQEEFLFEILAEVVFTHFVTHLQQVVELLAVKLVVLPDFGGALGRHGAALFEGGLQLLELGKILGGVFGREGHLLDALQDVELAVEILHALLLQTLHLFGAALAEGLYGFSELRFERVNVGNEGLGLAAAVNEGLTGCNDFLVVKFVVKRLQEVNLLFVAGGGAGSQCLHACHYFLLGGVERCVFCFHIQIHCLR